MKSRKKSANRPRGLSDKPDKPFALDANTSWIQSRGVFWVYLGMILVFRFFVGVVFRLDPGLSWTLTLQTHAVITFMSFHWNKGLPFQEMSGLQQGQARAFTFWEQLNQSDYYYTTRKLLTLVPIVLYMVSLYYASANETHLLLNTVASLAVICGKLPFMHGVRLFGINKE